MTARNGDSIMAKQRVSCASAPGKVILFGEHAVVFGQPAIAASLSALRIHVKVATTTSNNVDICMPDLPNPLHATFEATYLMNSTFKGPPTKENAATIHKMLQESHTSPLDEIALSALTPLVYLLNKLTPKIFASGMEITVQSRDLPVGAGLGSSAAFSVALVAALFGLSLHHSPIGRPSKRQLEVINQYAFYSEILLHGTPSGIDNAVSTYGKAILYTKLDGAVDMNHVEQLPPLEILLTNTHVPRSTRTLVAGVRSMYNAHVEVVQGILDSMGAITRQFQEMIRSDDFESRGEELMTLIRTNQLLLRAVGVSHPSLDLVCSIVDEVGEGSASTKLTGAGGGGCAVTLLRPDASPDLSRKIQKALEMESKRSPWTFSCLTSTVGGDGVLWTDPNEFVVEEESKRTNRGSKGNREEEKSLRISLATIAVAAGLALLATRVVSR